MKTTIQIKLTRDSVCMGDDIDDHTKSISIIPQESIAETVMYIAKEYLPIIAGYGHTWDCILNHVRCAVISGNCAKITYVTSADFTKTNNLYFKYHSATY